MILEVLTLILLASSATSEEISGSIVNGEDARIQDYPYMAKIWIGPYPTCGGSIISTNIILSAAHCFPEISFTFGVTSVMVGSSFRDGRRGGQRYRVFRPNIHPGYIQDDFTFMYDVAILRTISQIQFNNRVRPIEVSPSFVNVGVLGTVTGWGFTAQGLILPQFADQLQRMEAITISDMGCYDRLAHHPRSRWLNEQNVCVISDFQTSVCGGDSGSPLVIANRVVGVVSWRLRDCGDGTPDVFVRTSAVYDWINSFL